MPSRSFERTAQLFNAVVSLGLAGFCVVTSLTSATALGSASIWTIGLCAAVAGAYGIWLLQLTRRGQFLPVLRWVGTMGLLLCLTAIKASFMSGRFGYGGVIKDSLTFDLYFVIVILSAFYNDRRLTLAAGAIAAGLYVLLGVVGVAFFGLRLTMGPEGNVDPNLLRWHLELVRAALLVMSGWALTVIIGHLQQLLDDVKRSEEQARAVLAATALAQPEVKRVIRPIEETAQLVADGATAQATASRQLAAATETLAEGFAATARGASEAKTEAEKTKASAEEGNRHLGTIKQGFSEMTGQAQGILASVEALGEAVDGTEAINETLGDISESLRFLALNASLEAAKAGDQGRGFALVADETKRLVDQTTTGLEKARALLDNIRERVRQIRQATGETTTQLSTSLTDLNQVVDRIGEVSSGFARAAKEIDTIAAAAARQAHDVRDLSSALAALDDGAKQLNGASATLLGGVAQIQGASQKLEQALAQGSA
ncbi:MAG: methyl-accepting chemotaxis protein [Myxococcales bacterium]